MRGEKMLKYNLRHTWRMGVTSIITWGRWLTTVVNRWVGLSPVITEVGRVRFSSIFGGWRGVPSVVGGRITSIIVGWSKFSPVITPLRMRRFGLSSVILWFTPIVWRRRELLASILSR